MRKIYLMFISLIISCYGFAQITIEDCHLKAQANYPLIQQYDLIEKTKDYNLSNASKGYLPQLLFSAKVTYQSAVTEIPISIPGMDIKGLSKDQYGASLELTQTIWDGGVIKSQKNLVTTNSDVEKANLNVNIYAVNDRVNQLYFGILLVDERIEQNKLLQDELRRNFEKINAYVRNGIATQADLDAIKVEQLKAVQMESELRHTKKSYTEMLSILIGEIIGETIEFIKPIDLYSINGQNNRPELFLFDAQMKNLEAKKKEINAGLMPKIGLFITGGYGKPGLNMLENDFSAYYIGGIRLSWNISSLYTNKNSKRTIETGINSVKTQRETFLFNTSLDMTSKHNEIDKYRDQLKYDDEIISLRNSVKRASEAKMENGTISGIDLMRDINAEDMAKQDKILHEIELLLAIYNLKYVTNN